MLMVIFEIISFTLLNRAADWPQEPIWTGKLKIIAKNKLATIILLNDKNVVFGQCPVTDDAAVERTLDSGRYFVLRIQNEQGKHAFIGIAFNERNDAFEFNVALQEFKTQNERESAPSANVSTIPLRDLSLKEGEKIKINIAKKKKEDGTTDLLNVSSASTSKPSGGLLAPPPGNKGGLLAPPPGNKGGLLAPPPSGNAAKPTSAMSSFDSFNTNSNSTSSSSTNAFSSFDTFGSSSTSSFSAS